MLKYSGTRFILPVLFSLICFLVKGQAYFTAPDTICINDSVIIDNQSRDATTYYWNFCSGSLAYSPEGENLGNMGNLNGPAFIDFARSPEGYYAFITNHANSKLSRYFYGEDLLSEPDAINLGDFGGIIPNHAQGVQVIEDGGKWYVFIVGGQREDSRLVRLDFGASLANNSPNAIDFGHFDILDYPVDLYIDQVDGAWTGFTVNKNTHSLTRFDFPQGPGYPPVGVNLGNPADLLSPCGIFPIRENGNWYLFISNYEGHYISRLDFGSSLTSIPSGNNLGGNEVLHYPFDLTLIRDCERIYGFVLNRFNDIVRMEFTNNIEGPPLFTSLGEIGVLYNPQGISDIFRVGDNLYNFVVNIDNSTITRLVFEGCQNANPPSSTNRNPPAITYNAPGTYNINLVIDEGLPTQENYCLNVEVLESPEMSLGNDTLIPAGSSVILSPDTIYSTYEWSTGSEEATIEVFDAGVYYLTITNENGCKAGDDIEVILDIGIPNFFTPNGDGFNDTWSIPFLHNKPESEIRIFDRFGNTLAQYQAGQGEWDGTVQGRTLPEGTYWYVIKVPGIQKPFQGSVSIKR